MTDDSHEMSMFVFFDYQTIQIKDYLFPITNKKKLNCRLLQILLGALRVNIYPVADGDAQLHQARMYLQTAHAHTFIGILQTDSKVSDWTVWMHRLILAFAVCICRELYELSLNMAIMGNISRIVS